LFGGLNIPEQTTIFGTVPKSSAYRIPRQSGDVGKLDIISVGLTLLGRDMMVLIYLEHIKFNLNGYLLN
jgi:hypothetical protein